IQSAPTVQTPDFGGNVQISGAFDETEVRGLARVLNRGAFPVPVEQQRVETVSATAGQDSLNAALIAGLVGVVVMLAFMIAYYRKLSVIILAGLVVWGITVFSLATFISQATNYALTLAGATGIIVAVGVTVDTYVVLFERLKDELRHGRSFRNAAPRSFKSTWRTIVSADLVSLLASFILFALSVGSVKGFALYLGITTICDLLVCYFFTRPAILLLSTTKWFHGEGSDRAATVGTPTGALA
ncbi:MAG: SecD/SecF family protein translocase subunit, partial [Ilumatobacteraceae bacterium]